MARKKAGKKKRSGPKDKAFNVTDGVTNFIGASITTELVLNNPNPVDVLIGGWTHSESHPYRTDGRLDLRELLAPIFDAASGRGAGFAASSAVLTGAGVTQGDWTNSGTIGKYQFLGRVMMENVRRGLPRAVFSSMALPVGRMFFKQTLAKPLNKMLTLDWVPFLNNGKKKQSQKGLRKFIKF